MIGSGFPDANEPADPIRLVEFAQQNQTRFVDLFGV